MSIWLDFAQVVLALGAGWICWLVITAARSPVLRRLDVEVRAPRDPRPVVNRQAVDSEG